MNRVLCLLIVLAGMGCGSSPAPSIVGKWRHDWDVDGNKGFEIKEFMPDGRYRGETQSENTSGTFSLKVKDEGTYTFVTGKLEIVRTAGVAEMGNPKTGMVRTVPQTKAITSKWSKAELTETTLILGDPDGVRTGDTKSLFKRVE